MAGKHRLGNEQQQDESRGCVKAQDLCTDSKLLFKVWRSTKSTDLGCNDPFYLNRSNSLNRGFVSCSRIAILTSQVTADCS